MHFIGNFQAAEQAENMTVRFYDLMQRECENRQLPIHPADVELNHYSSGVVFLATLLSTQYSLTFELCFARQQLLRKTVYLISCKTVSCMV